MPRGRPGWCCRGKRSRARCSIAGAGSCPSAGGASGGWRPSAAGPWSSTRSRSRSTGTSSPTSRPACAARPSRRPGLDSDCQSPPYRLPPKAHTHAPPREACMAELTRRDVLKLAAAGAAAAVPGLPRAAQAQTTQKRELVVAQGGDIAFLDPHLSTSSNDIRISFNIFDNLTSRRPDGKLAPGLATEWKLQGQTTWAFKLRPGVKWHNGDPFTSADVKFSIDRTLDTGLKGNRVNTVLATVDRVETLDPGTAVVHTKKPDPLLPARLGFYGGQIIPKKYVESVGPDTFNQKPVGTGPLRFVSWTKDDKVVLEANPGYWGGRVDFDRLVVRALPEMAPRVAALLKGEVDLITQVPPDQGERLKGNAGTTVTGALYGGLYVLAVNSKKPPLDNPLVKQALSLAIDREAIVKELWRGRGIVPNSMIAKGDNHYDASLPPLAYSPQDKAMSEAIAAMWKDVGVNVVIEVIEYSVRAQKGREKTFKGVWWSDHTSTLGDPDGMMWR